MLHNKHPCDVESFQHDGYDNQAEPTFRLEYDSLIALSSGLVSVERIGQLRKFNASTPLQYTYSQERCDAHKKTDTCW